MVVVVLVSNCGVASSNDQGFASDLVDGGRSSQLVEYSIVRGFSVVRPSLLPSSSFPASFHRLFYALLLLLELELEVDGVLEESPPDLHPPHFQYICILIKSTICCKPFR